MLLNELETIYTASDAEYQRVADRVDSRLKQSTKTAEKELRDQQRTAERLQRDQIQSVERLISRLPGGARVTQFKTLADDIKLASSAARDGEGALTALGGASGAALVGISALVIGAAALGAGVFKATLHFVEAAGKIKDLGQESGLSAETLSTLAAFSTLAGKSIDQTTSALEVYAKNVAEAAHGNEAMSKTFERFGIDAKEALKNPDKAARDLFDHLAAIPNEWDRIDAAQKLAGKSGKILASVALEMGGSFDKAMASAREWGIVLSEDDVEAADKFGDAWEVLKMRAESVIFDIARGALPELQNGIDDVSGGLGDSHEAWREFGREAGTVLRGLILLASNLKALTDGVSGMDAANRIRDSYGNSNNDPFEPGADELEFGVDETTSRRKSGAGDYDIKKKGGKGGSGANRAAQAFLEAARIDLREAESVYKEENAIAKRALDLNLNDFADYQKRRTEAENERYAKQQESFAKERQAGGADKLKEIQQRETDALREHNERKAAITTDGLLHDLDVKKRFADVGARIQEESNRVAELDLAQQLARGETTYEQAMQGRLEIARELAEKQGEVLRVALEKSLGNDAKALSETIDTVITEAVNGADAEGLQEGFDELLKKAANPEAVQEALDVIKEFFLKRKQAWQQGTGDTKEAQDQDLRVWQDYADRLTQIFDEIQAAEFERRELEIAPLEDNNFKRGAGIEARQVLDTAREEARSAIALDALHKKLNDERTRREGERPEVIRTINAQIEAEERLSHARLVEIDREANEERRRQLVEIAGDIAGILTTGLESFDGIWKSVWSSMLQDALSVLQQIGAELLKMAAEGLFTGSTKGSSAGGIVGFLANKVGGALLGGMFGGGGHSLGGGLASGGGSGNGPFNASGIIPGRAKGGPVSAGTLYEVNEEGREYFRPDQDGEIIPIGKGGGGQGATVTDNSRTYNIMLPPRRAASTYRSRRGAREAAEDLLGFIR